MDKKSLTSRLNALRPEGVSMEPQPHTLTYIHYSMDLTCTERQLDHVKSRLRMLKIKFDVREVSE